MVSLVSLPVCLLGKISCGLVSYSVTMFMYIAKQLRCFYNDANSQIPQ